MGTVTVSIVERVGTREVPAESFVHSVRRCEMWVVGVDAGVHNGPGDALAARVKSPPARRRLDRVRGTEQVTVGRLVHPELVDPLRELGKFL